MNFYILIKEKIEKWTEEYPCRILIFMMLITIAIVYGDFLIGEKYLVYYDIGSDTYDQYIPVLSAIVNKLRNADFSLWEMNYGLGTDMINRGGNWIDLFNIPVFIAGYFGGTRVMLYSITLVQICKSVISGFICFQFLGVFEFKNIARIIASYIFAFNGFIMLWGQHYFFATANVCCILIFYLIELSFRNKKYFLHLTISIALTLMFSVYVAYMIAAAAFYYLILRIIMNVSVYGVKKTVTLIGQFLGSAAVGGMISAVISMPSMYQIICVTSRLNNSESVLSRIINSFHNLPAPCYYKWILFRFISNNLEGTADVFAASPNYYALENLFFSCVIVLMLVLFFSEEIIWGKRKVFYIINVLIFGASFVFPVFHLYFNMFSGTYTRYSFVYMPVLAIVAASVLDRMGSFHVSSIIAMCLTVAGSVGLLLFRHENIDEIKYTHYLNYYIYLLCFLMMLFAIIVTASRLKKECWLRTAGIIIIVMISVIIDSFYTTDVRNAADQTYTISKPGMATEDSLQVIEYIKNNEAEESVYRIEKDFLDASSSNDALNMDYAGVSQYNSSTNKYLESFMVNVWPKALGSPNNSIYIIGRNDIQNDRMLSLLGIKYIMSRDSIYPEYTKIYGPNETVNIYRNDKAGGLGIFFDSVISEKEFLEYPIYDRQKILGNSIVLSAIPDDFKDKRYQGKIADDYNYTENSVVFFKDGNDGHLKAEVNIDEDRVLFVSIPYDIGWKAYIDNKETDIMKGNLGFQALMIPSGHHIIELRYTTPLIEAGSMISMIGIVALSVMTVVYRKYLGRSTVCMSGIIL